MALHCHQVLTFGNGSGSLGVEWLFRKLGLIISDDLLKSYLLGWVKRYTNLCEIE